MVTQNLASSGTSSVLQGQKENGVNVNNLKAMPVKIDWRPDLPIFASEGFLKSLGEEYGWVGGSDDTGRLRCVLPYTVIRKPGFRMVRFRVETIPTDGDLSLEAEQSFLNSTVEYFRSRGADLIIPAANTALFRTYPEGSIAAPYGTFIKDLTKPADEMWNELHADYRQNIRKAGKKGIEVKTGPQFLEPAYHLLVDTLKRSGLKFKSHSEFEMNLQNLGENVKIFVAESEGVIQACMISPFSLHTAYDWYSGTISKPARGSMHLLIWEAMRQFQQLGVRQFNFTGVRVKPEPGSKQEGIKNFKMRFGGRLVEGHMWKYSFHPLKSLAYSLGVRLVMGGDVVDLERNKK
jgi:Acetyltransferase (GNAT) domain